uniref:EGF-like domain-containing protein n=1 Tax=Acrobeloides nanus TaxID=290746 RepID=A0A914E7R0_9BILA
MLSTGSNFTIHCLGILSTIVIKNEVYIRCTDEVLIDNQTIPISTKYTTTTTEIPSTSGINHLRACGPNILVGEQCGDDPNYRCKRGPFFATCKCTNGYFQMENEPTKCYCPRGMVDNNGKCSCATGYVSVLQHDHHYDFRNKRLTANAFNLRRVAPGVTNLNATMKLVKQMLLTASIFVIAFYR